MGRQRERLKEIVRVEGPGPAVERGREVGGRCQAVEALGGGREFGWGRLRWGPASCGGGLLGSVGNPSFPSVLLPTQGPPICSFCDLTSLALSQDLIQTPH